MDQAVRRRAAETAAPEHRAGLGGLGFNSLDPQSLDRLDRLVKFSGNGRQPGLAGGRCQNAKTSETREESACHPPHRVGRAAAGRLSKESGGGEAFFP